MQDWLFRIDKEMERSTTPLFVTLTYDEQNVPLTESGLKTLRKKDIQDWMKKLRHHYEKFSKNKIKYYIVGEYGTRTKRPHYHAIMLNMARPELINETWGKGFTYSPTVRNGGISYVLKYVSKERGEWTDDRQREFSLVSKGIGDNYITDTTKKFHHNRTENCFITTKGGHKISIPKYFKEKIYSDEQRGDVTRYLKRRMDNIGRRKLEETAKRKSVGRKNAETNLEIRKMNSKFDKRNEKL